MICTSALTPRQIADSKRNYLLYCLVNGFSYMCLGETVIILFAVRLNAPNAVAAILGAMIYFGFLLLPLGKWMTARVGAAASQADFWVLRNIAVLLVALAAPVSLYVNQTLAIIVLLIGSFFFYGFRAAGVVMSQPLIAEICEPEKRGALISYSTSLFYITGIISLLTVSFLVKLYTSLWVLTGIIVAGSLLGMTASGFIRKISETEQIRDSAKKPVSETFREVIGTRSIRHQMLAGMACNLMVILTAPISILALKRGYSYSDTGALVYSLVQFGAMALASLVMGKIAGKLGPRLLTIIGYWLLPLTSLFWVLVPQKVHPLLLSIPFLFCGAGTIAVTNGIAFYFVMSVKKELQVVASMVIAVATGVGAGLSGMLLGSLLLKAAEYFSLPADPTRIYRVYFAMTLFIFAAGAFFVHRLIVVIDDYRRTHGEKGVQEVVQHHHHHRS